MTRSYTAIGLCHEQPNLHQSFRKSFPSEVTRKPRSESESKLGKGLVGSIRVELFKLKEQHANFHGID